MPSLTNPFDLLPANLFNVFSTQGQGGLQRHYMAILLRLYEMAEFNRFGLTRDVVIADIVEYLTKEGLDSLPQALPENGDEPLPGTVQEYASWMLRRLVEVGWLEREQQADYTEFIILPDYAFTLLEALRTIQQQKPREYTGQLYAAHQLITHQGENFSPALALTQAYENVRQVVRGLNELNQNIRRYIERVSRNQSVAELLRLQYDEYSQALGPAYHALKTSDHVSRYRRDIIGQLQNWQLDAAWLDATAAELATQGRSPPPRLPTKSIITCASSSANWKASTRCWKKLTGGTASICAPRCARFATNWSALTAALKTGSPPWPATWPPCKPRAKAGCRKRCPLFKPSPPSSRTYIVFIPCPNAARPSPRSRWSCPYSTRPPRAPCTPPPCSSWVQPLPRPGSKPLSVNFSTATASSTSTTSPPIPSPPPPTCPG
ncbi:MAG: hypothetical protein HC875_12345 [Anaerolineales bacterium]|nr:hypothetical protein [Anaerolineales bacterium]